MVFIFIFHCRTLEISIWRFSNWIIQFCIKDNSVLKTIQFWRDFIQRYFFPRDFFWRNFFRRYFFQRYFFRRCFLRRNLYNKFLDIFLQVDQGVIWRTMMDWESLAAVAEKVDEGQIPTTKQAVYVRQRSSIVFYQAKQDWKLIALHDFAKKKLCELVITFFVNLYL